MIFIPKFIRHAIDKCYTYTLIKTSGLFDADWYMQTYDDVSSSGMSPLKHFLKRGYKKGYSPSTKFSCTRYLGAYPMVKGCNPLIHYLKTGRLHGYNCYGTKGDGIKAQPSAAEPLISVVIINCNSGQFIEQALRSVLSQTYKNTEIIVVDGGSEDDSVQVISKYVSSHRNVSLHQHQNEKRQDLIATVLLGIEKSQGQYIAFCKGDDYWTQDYLEKKLEIISQYEGVEIISNDVELTGDNVTKEQTKNSLQPMTQLLVHGGNAIDLQHHQDYNWIPTLSAAMIKADTIKNLDFNCPVPAEIDFWLYRQILKNKLLFYVDAKLTFWRQHDLGNYTCSGHHSMTPKDCYTSLVASNKLIGVKSEQLITPKCITKSRFFNKKYYSSQLGEQEVVQSLAHHYYRTGWKQGLNPSEAFDGDAYLTLNTDLIAAQMCPLFHYEYSGKKENRRCVSVSISNERSIKPYDIDNIRKRKKNQKVALLISHELSLTGAPRALYNLAQSLKNCGIYPVIVSPKDGELRKEIEESGIECKIVLAMIAHEKNPNLLRTPFSEYVKEFHLVLFNTLVTIPIIESWAKLDIRKICWIHEGTMVFDNSAYNGRLTYYLSLFDQVYVVGDYVNKILHQRTNNCIEATNLLYGIEDNPSYLSNDFRKKDKIRMAVVGTIDYRKGHDILVDSIGFIPLDVRKKIEILILGKSVDKTIAAKINNCHDIDFRMMGEIEHGKLLELINSIDILICPSRDDPMPIVCTEAMMLSKPLIVSTHTGTASLVHDGVDGFIFDSGSSEQLAHAITNAVNNIDMLPEIGRRARKIYEAYFSLEQFDKNVERLL